MPVPVSSRLAAGPSSARKILTYLNWSDTCMSIRDEGGWWKVSRNSSGGPKQAIVKSWETGTGFGRVCATYSASLADGCPRSGALCASGRFGTPGMSGTAFTQILIFSTFGVCMSARRGVRKRQRL